MRSEGLAAPYIGLIDVNDGLVAPHIGLLDLDESLTIRAVDAGFETLFGAGAAAVVVGGLVGLRVLHGFFDLGHNHVRNGAAGGFDAFDLHPGHGQERDQFIYGRRQFDQFGQPVQ